MARPTVLPLLYAGIITLTHDMGLAAGNAPVHIDDSRDYYLFPIVPQDVRTSCPCERLPASRVPHGCACVSKRALPRKAGEKASGSHNATEGGRIITNDGEPGGHRLQQNDAKWLVERGK